MKLRKSPEKGSASTARERLKKSLEPSPSQEGQPKKGSDDFILLKNPKNPPAISQHPVIRQYQSTEGVEVAVQGNKASIKPDGKPNIERINEEATTSEEGEVEIHSGIVRHAITVEEKDGKLVTDEGLELAPLKDRRQSPASSPVLRRTHKATSPSQTGKLRLMGRPVPAAERQERNQEAARQLVESEREGVLSFFRKSNLAETTVERIQADKVRTKKEEAMRWTLENPEQALHALNQGNIDDSNVEMVAQWLTSYATNKLSGEVKEAFLQQISLAQEGQLGASQDTIREEVPTSVDGLRAAAETGHIAPSGSVSPEMQTPQSYSPEMEGRLSRIREEAELGHKGITFNDDEKEEL